MSRNRILAAVLAACCSATVLLASFTHTNNTHTGGGTIIARWYCDTSSGMTEQSQGCGNNQGVTRVDVEPYVYYTWAQWDDANYVAPFGWVLEYAFGDPYLRSE